MQVVVVGNGPVGARFVAALRGRDPAGRFRVRVLGAEEHGPYDRSRLSDVVAGRLSVAQVAAPPGDGGVLRGTTAVAVDRTERVVVDQSGGRHPYDVVVLATGARARVPAVAGLRTRAGSLRPGVHALRTLDDAREIVAATLNARRAVVVGGGVLGVEAACALVGRGLDVTLVHGGPHLMDRQLTAAAADVLAGSLTGLGVDVRVAARTEQVLAPHGPVTDVRLESGERVPADLLVLAAGSVPEVGLAQLCGLDVGRGVVVRGDLSTPADPRVFAIGDCAEPAEGMFGLVSQGFAQAERLAEALAAPGLVPDDAARRTDVVRVRSRLLDVVAAGADARTAVRAGARRAVLSEPEAGRHVEVTVADGALVGLVCLGGGPAVSGLVEAYTNGAGVPDDPAVLLGQVTVTPTLS